MNIKYIPVPEYEKLWEDLKSRMQFSSPGIDPVMKRMTVQGLSGQGTSFKNEYERLMHEHSNPAMPREIRMIGVDGEEMIRPERE